MFYKKGLIIMKEKIREKLFELQDLKYKEFHGGLCPGTENIIGVRIPVLRKYAKELISNYKVEELLKSIGDEYYEEIMLKGILIGIVKEKDINKIFNYMEEFIPKIDNWAVCDVFCAGLKITKKHKKEMWKFIQKYIKSDREFEVRFAVVMILDYYIEEEYIESAFSIFNENKNEAYYVQMAIAWAISLCIIKYYDKTLKFLKSKECKIDNFTFNKSIQKAIESYRITDEKKAYLRTLKK
jgi:3-methyladenine DNA glycosylase AlkD